MIEMPDMHITISTVVTVSMGTPVWKWNTDAKIGISMAINKLYNIQ